MRTKPTMNQSCKRLLQSLSKGIDARVSYATEQSCRRCVHSGRGVLVRGWPVLRTNLNFGPHINFQTTRGDSTSAISAEKEEENGSTTPDEVAMSLIDEWRHVPGSWSADELKTAEDILPHLSPNLAFPLYHRILIEMDFNGNLSPDYCTTRFYIPLLESWKEAYVNQHRSRSATTENTPAIPAPNEIFNMLATVSKIPGFQYQPIAVSLVLGAVISTHRDRSQTPFIVQDMVVANAPPRYRNCPHLVGQLIQTWAVSGLRYQEVSRNIDRLLKSVPKLNIVLFNSAIHYYSRNNDMQRVEELIHLMKQQGVQPDGATFNHLAHGYARAGQLRAAFDSLEQLVEYPSTTEDQMASCAVGVMDAIRRRVREARNDVHDVVYADQILQLIRSRLDGISRNRILAMLIDVYGCHGNYERAEQLFLQIENPDSVQYSIMIKASGLNKSVGNTKKWFAKLLDSGLRVDIDSFNNFINALAETNESGVVDLAHDVIYSMQNELRFKGIEPNLMTYNSLLKCIATSRDPDAAEQVVKVLDEIEQHGFQPDHITLSFCYKACIGSDDVDACDRMLRLIESIRPAPSIKFFNSLLNEWASVGSPNAVQKIEELMQSLHKMAKTNPAVRPNVFSYGILIKALTTKRDWTGVPAKIAETFEIMERNRIKPDRAILGSSVMYLCTQSTPEYVHKAADLLIQIEDIDHFHLCEVVKHLLRVNAEQKVVVLLNTILDRIAANNGSRLGAKTFKRILTLFCRKGYLRNASDLLTKLDMYSQEKQIKRLLTPDCYQLVIEAWQASSDYEKDDFVKLHSKAKLQHFQQSFP